MIRDGGFGLSDSSQIHTILLSVGLYTIACIVEIQDLPGMNGNSRVASYNHAKDVHIVCETDNRGSAVFLAK